MYSTEVVPHTDCSVMITVHCAWHASGIAHALRQPSSVLTWHRWYLIVQAEFMTRVLDFEYVSTIKQCTWFVLVGASSVHTMCHACVHAACMEMLSIMFYNTEFPGSPPPTDVKLMDWENYRHLRTVPKCFGPQHQPTQMAYRGGLPNQKTAPSDEQRQKYATSSIQQTGGSHLNGVYILFLVCKSSHLCCRRCCSHVHWCVGIVALSALTFQHSCPSCILVFSALSFWHSCPLCLPPFGV